MGKIMFNYLLKRLALFLCAAVLIAITTGFIFLDILVFDNGISETSVTELGQETIVAMICLFFFVKAYQDSEQRGAFTLIMGFFLCILIRELDGVFDQIAHGSWVWFALTVTFISIAIAIREGKRTLKGLIHFITHPSHGMLVAGLLCILLFSRLFGMGILWSKLLGEDYNRTVKNMVEEGSELFGYTLCLISVIWYGFSAKDHVIPATIENKYQP
ncbi:hypothetical protein OSB94_05550 [Proteus vulgaris]|uniref:hypothetical protein n=1 Tax=Proteus TaxID=583 RepID=UPI000D691E89|nr:MULTISPECIES: hypothetical protein [Proteus]MBQ0211999.1 hypothetical protein [Proteus vulgaris]MDS0787554.1 hypothetical protein [Proteus vulgaris]